MRLWFGALLSCLIVSETFAVEDAAVEDAAVEKALVEKSSDPTLVSIVTSKCIDCHSGGEPAGQLDLRSFDQEDRLFEKRRLWTRILARVQSHEMPPPDAEALTADELKFFVERVERLLATSDPTVAPGPATARRINKFEYNTTIRDLLGIHIDAAQGLPVEGAGGEGFDNAVETLILSPVHFEKYVQAAKDAIDYVQRDKTAREMLLKIDNVDNLSEKETAERILHKFMDKAFHRPCEPEEIARYLSIYESELARGQSFDQSVLAAMQAVLISPQFLFRFEAPPPAGKVERLTPHELATRLSYFLWASIPDESLDAAARDGSLLEEETLRKQVDRMLTVTIGSNRSDVPKANALAESFMGQWLGTRDLGVRFIPDKTLFRRYDHELETSLRYEPVYFFEHMLVENTSLLDLLDSKYTFMNSSVARHYALTDKVKIRGFGQMVRVDLPEDSVRGGVITMGAVLAISSYPHRTSPVLRGKWILDTFYDVTLPPPPDVPPLEENDATKADAAEQKSLRERLEAHRNNAACASCHDRIDPLGFGLENFDAVGRWRDQESGKPVDASGKLPGGQMFEGPVELKKILLSRKDIFVRGLTAKMLSYALGRGLVDSDFYTVEKIVQRLRENDYKTRELIYGIVESIPFQYKVGPS